MIWKDQKYTVIEEIADHGNKAIYRCINNLSGQRVIAKVLGAKVSTYEAIMRIKKEYKLLSELSPTITGIIRPIQLEERGGYMVLTLEDISGESLKSIMNKQRLDTQTILHVAIKLTDIIGSIHERQIIHKDIKPANLIWNRETDELRLIDFDLSVRWHNEKSDYIVNGVMEGSLGYISPEQTGRINRTIDYRSDFYSLGVTLYEMLTGSRPHPMSSTMDQIYAIIARKPVSPYEQTSGKIPQSLSNIVMKLLEKSPEDRYRSAYGIRADLRKCLASPVNYHFKVGQDDRMTFFRIPQKLYGRDQEMALLENALDRSIQERVQLVLVAGEAGVGKTAFVNELQTSVSTRKGYLVQGKFEQYNKNIPYSAFIEALRSLLSQWMNGPDEERIGLQHALKLHLGANAGLMTRWLPELEQLIGSQREPDQLLPVEENNRFFMSVLRLLETLAGQQKPIVLFLDDVQWADGSSIQLFTRLLESKTLKRVMMIASYRPNEVNELHPLTIAMQRVQEQEFIHQLHLLPLSEAAIQQFISDTVELSTQLLRWIAPIIYRQTGGNPFFVQEILRDLYKQQALYFDEGTGQWNLDRSRIHALTSNEDLIDYLIQKMKTLPSETQLILSTAALIGRSFHWRVLQLIGHADKNQLLPALLQAVAQDILLPQQASYHLLDESSLSTEELNRLDIQFTFQHDKLQQALYQMIDPKLRKNLHVKLGWLLLNQHPENGIKTDIMDIAGHLNQGLELVVRDDDRERIIEVNLQAGRRAKKAFGYGAALTFLDAAIGLSTVHHWSTHYERMYELHFLYSECAYLLQKWDQGDRISMLLLEKAETDLEQASIYEMRSSHYMYLGMMEEAIAAGIDGLACFNFKMPKRFTMANVAKELIAVKLKLGKRKPQELLEEPEVKEPRMKMIMRLLRGFAAPSFITGKKELFAWSVLKQTALSVRYGNSPESAGAYVGYAMLLSGLGDFKGAEEYGRLAVELNRKFDDLQWRSQIHVLYTLFCYTWSHDWETLEEEYSLTMEYSLQSGDLLYVSHAYYYMNLWNPGMEIDTYLQESDYILDKIEDTNYMPTLATARLAQQKFRLLAGKLERTDSLDEGAFSEKEYLELLHKARYYSGIAIYYVTHLQISFLFEQKGRSKELLQHADPVMPTLAGSAFMEEASFYTLMCLAADYDLYTAKEKGRVRRRMKRELGRMKKLANHHPHNFLSQYEMMQAEWLRVNERYREAEGHYHQALRHSEQGHFTRYKAIASELAGRFYLERQLPEIAAYYVKQASYYYSVWGAKAKAMQLQSAYEDLMGHIQWLPLHGDQTMSISTENIDIHLLLKASQSFSREIEIDQLLHNIMNVVLINAGAQRGCMIMKSGPSLWAEGRYDEYSDQINVQVYHDQHTLGTEFPWLTLEEVATDKETLIYSDARLSNRLSDVRYMSDHQPKSVLCMPLVNQDRVIAVIYLENNLITGAFTRERLNMINLLSREMVYAIENASLYSELEHLVTQRTEELAIKNDQLIKYLDIVDKNVIIANIDTYGRIVHVSEEFCFLTRYKREELIGKPHQFFKLPSERNDVLEPFVMNASKTWHGELLQFCRDQSKLWLDVVIEPEFDGKKLVGYTCIGQNITDKKQIERLSITDELTGLYNRRYFNSQIAYKLEQAAIQQASITFILLDIDHYKKYNDIYGHYEGDNVLRIMGSTLLKQTGNEKMAFRLGGEEFAILYIGSTYDESYEHAERIRDSIEALQIPHAQNDAAPYVTVSIGVGFIEATTQSLSEEELYRLADEALYGAKDNRRNCVVIHTDQAASSPSKATVNRGAYPEAER
ncbi:diguanylate cyclase [Paenibacillus campi]|uniref:diguanylate cyclase n=1 Tax=Paenibacillus campi TaxID=3106031 RepID=UPI002AFF5254|nr:diguanylate cyclase [Paenibacillus sp. SGZ-1014]